MGERMHPHPVASFPKVEGEPLYQFDERIYVTEGNRIPLADGGSLRVDFSGEATSSRLPIKVSVRKVKDRPYWGDVLELISEITDREGSVYEIREYVSTNTLFFKALQNPLQSHQSLFGVRNKDWPKIREQRDKLGLEPLDETSRTFEIKEESLLGRLLWRGDSDESYPFFVAHAHDDENPSRSLLHAFNYWVENSSAFIEYVEFTKTYDDGKEHVFNKFRVIFTQGFRSYPTAYIRYGRKSEIEDLSSYSVKLTDSGVNPAYPSLSWKDLIWKDAVHPMYEDHVLYFAKPWLPTSPYAIKTNRKGIPFAGLVYEAK
jgi:hypothetical protein